MIDTTIVRGIMFTSLALATFSLLTIGLTYFKAHNGWRKKVIMREAPRLVWLLHVAVFYVYTLLIHKYMYQDISDTYTYIWGALLILHNVINTMAITVIRMTTHDAVELIDEAR
jgi:hypothetical protein